MEKRSAIIPLADAAREEVAAYLVAQGHAPEIVAWKYFDDEFNANRNRGWVWMRDGQVAGFIGVLPFDIARGDETLPAHWLCDWSIADFEQHRGAGVRLFKRALEGGLHFVLGGNANSLQPMEKMASRTVHDADAEFRIFLRAGAVLDRVAQRVPPASFLSRSALGRIRLPRPRPDGWHDSVRIKPGVLRGIEPLLEPAASDSWSASYSLKYLQWQFERCPALRAWTVLDARERAALTLWHPKSSPRVWRAILWPRPNEPRGAASVLDAGVWHAQRRGAHELSVVTSRVDSPQHNLLKSRGFKATKTARPLFIYDGPAPQVLVEDLNGLNFLAADLGYRF